jgi:hypothetical protein
MDRKEFLVRDYEVKADYLSGHQQRLLTRFNFFVTLETALFGSEFIFGEGGVPRREVAVVGIFLSIVWLLVGVDDARILRIHKWHVKRALDRIMLEFPIENFHPVGEVSPRVVEELLKEEEAKEKASSQEAKEKASSQLPPPKWWRLAFGPLISLFAREKLKLLLLIIVPLLVVALWSTQYGRSF